MQSDNKITNEVLYEFLKDFKRDVGQRLGQQDKRMDRQDLRLDRIERKIDDIHECRHEVKIQFHWKLAAASVAISAGVSVVVFLAMSPIL